MSNPIGWVEIPVTNMENAISFYNEVFGWDLHPQQLGDVVMAIFPFDPEVSGAGGALVYLPDFYQPSETLGPLVYFSCDDCALMDEKTERAGGRIEIPKKEIGEGYGYMSVVIDPEGNRIGFHSMN